MRASSSNGKRVVPLTIKDYRDAIHRHYIDKWADANKPVNAIWLTRLDKCFENLVLLGVRTTAELDSEMIRGFAASQKGDSNRRLATLRRP